MSPSTAAFDKQATELLRVAALPDIRRQLLKYATTLAKGTGADAQDYYQEALLGAHDMVMRKGFKGTQQNDYKFYLMAYIKTAHYDSQHHRRQHTLVGEFSEELMEELPNPGPAHLAEQVALEIEAHPDRVALRLSADGHSLRDIETLTGRSKSTVGRALEKMKDTLRETFGQAWASLD